MTKTEFKMAIVTWEDSAFTEHSISIEQARQHPTIINHTIGFVMKQRGKTIILSGELNPKAWSCRDTMSIPKGVIKNIQYLQTKKGRG